MTRISEIEQLRRDVAKADAESKKWAERVRVAFENESTRARVRDLNIRWAFAAERRDELLRMLKESEAKP